jgi:uncharacterized membrane protein
MLGDGMLLKIAVASSGSDIAPLLSIDDVPHFAQAVDRRAALCARIYLLAAVPIMLALAFLIGPFGTNDEREHFLRAVSIAGGSVVPTASYDPTSKRIEKRVAGAKIDSGVISVADEVPRSKQQRHSWLDPDYRLSRADLAARLAFRHTGNMLFAEHNNTALYPPFLYLGPIVGVWLSSLFDLPVLAWMYMGRLANVILASTLIWGGIRRSRESAPLFLVIGTLPIVLFQSATVSADALLLPIAVMFAAILSRWADRAEISRSDIILLSVATLVIAVGKVAYLPLAALPPAISFIVDRRWSSRQTFLLLWSLFAVLLWASWAYIVRDKVFSMMDHVIVNPGAQIRQMLDFPARNIKTFAHEMRTQISKLLLSSTGAHLGYQTVKLPKFFGGISLMMLLLAALASVHRGRRPVAVVLVAVGAAIGCYLAIYLLLYLQFNAVGSTSIAGAQGRYLTPLMVVVLALLPGLEIRAAWSDRLLAVLIGWSGLSCLLTVWAVLNRYWL